jgi:hypothetical protein
MTWTKVTEAKLVEMQQRWATELTREQQWATHAVLLELERLRPEQRELVMATVMRWLAEEEDGRRKGEAAAAAGNDE